MHSARAPASSPAPREARGGWVWIALLIGLAAWGAVLGANPRRAGDLRLYALAARRFWGGLPLYPASDGLISFKYSPAAAWLFTPFAVLPATGAAILWNLALVASFAFAAKTWGRALREDGRFVPSYLAFAAAALALGQSLFLELFYGQVNLWMLALLVAPLTAAARRREWLAGLCIGVAALVKPTAALLALTLFAAGRPRAVAWAAAWAVGLHLPVLLRYGAAGAVAELRAWSRNLEETAVAWVVGHNPQGLPTLLLAALYPLDARPPRALVAAAEFASAALVPLAAVLAGVRGVALWSVLCFAVAFVSPVAWRANFVLAWPMLVALLCTDVPRRRAGVAAVAGVAALEWVASEALLGPAAARSVLATHVWGLVFAAAVAVAIAVLPKGSARRHLISGAAR